MTSEEAAGILIGGSGETSDSKKPYKITYNDVSYNSGLLTEYYIDNTIKKVGIGLAYKGTVNEEVKYLRFYNDDGQSIKEEITFEGFYVG